MLRHVDVNGVAVVAKGKVATQHLVAVLPSVRLAIHEFLGLVEAEEATTAREGEMGGQNKLVADVKARMELDLCPERVQLLASVEAVIGERGRPPTSGGNATSA